MDKSTKDLLWGSCTIRTFGGNYLSVAPGGEDIPVLSDSPSPDDTCLFNWYTDGTIESLSTKLFLYNAGTDPFVLTAGGALPPMSYKYVVGPDGNNDNPKIFVGNIQLKNDPDQYWKYLGGFSKQIGLGALEQGQTHNATLFSIYVK